MMNNWIEFKLYKFYIIIDSGQKFNSKIGQKYVLISHFIWYLEKNDKKLYYI